MKPLGVIGLRRQVNQGQRMCAKIRTAERQCALDRIDPGIITVIRMDALFFAVGAKENAGLTRAVVQRQIGIKLKIFPGGVLVRFSA